MVRNSLLIVVIGLVFQINSSAKEGMWIPSVLSQMNLDEMSEMGFNLTAEEIYSINNSSLKDAVVHFGGGCTAELISGKGLLLTNHHCGYGQIQSHSSVENDYLKNGFWAMSNEKELQNPGLTATLIKRIEDVTEEALEGVTTDMTEIDRQAKIKENTQKIGKAAISNTHFEYIIKPFYYGNKYYIVITETFKDVRLVGAPPSSIGKFGFDTDNWVWPRHTGDFSIFRIYAGKDNKPADYSEENKPYKPNHFFPVSLKNEKEGDFTLLYGFPGRTQEYLTSFAVDYIMNTSNPAKIEMRDNSLSIINKAMSSNDKLRIQYAAKQSRISNSHKKWKGENIGLKKLDALNKKKEFETEFINAIKNDEQKEKYGNILNDYKTVYESLNEYTFAREYFIEIFFYGPEILRHAYQFNSLIQAVENDSTSEKRIDKMVASLTAKIDKFYKDYNVKVDEELMGVMFEIYMDKMKDDLTPDYLSELETKYDSWSKYATKLYSKSIFTSENKLKTLLENPSLATKKIKKDKAFQLAKALYNDYLQNIRPRYTELSNQVDLLNRTYLAGMMEMMPKSKRYYPDANSTLRVAYGQVEGYYPKDGVEYDFYTTLDGIASKYIKDDREFDVPEKLIQLHENKDYGPYGKDGEMRVCFIASNHSTGGNSGSPVLDGDGNLIGLNFDRCWEGTMSDIMFDSSICRNIMVDMNYVLFIVDKFAGAGHLVKEMQLVTSFD